MIEGPSANGRASTHSGRGMILFLLAKLLLQYTTEFKALSYNMISTNRRCKSSNALARTALLLGDPQATCLLVIGNVVLYPLRYELPLLAYPN